MKKYLSEIYYLLEGSRQGLVWLVPMVITSSFLDILGLGLIIPYVSLLMDPNSLGGPLAHLVEFFHLPKVREDLLVALGGILVALFLFKAFVAIWINTSIVRFSQDCAVRLKSKMMQAYQSMPYEHYLQRNSAEYVHAISQLTGIFSGNVVSGLVRMLCDGAVAFLIIGFLAWVNGQAIMLLIVMVAALVLIYDKVFTNRLRSYGERSNKAGMRILQAIHEGIEGFKEVRILRKEKYFLDTVQQDAMEYSTYVTRLILISSAPRYLMEVLLILFIVLFVIITIYTNGSLNEIAPVLAMFSVAAVRLLPMINSMSSGMTQMRFHRHSVSRLYNDMELLAHTPVDVVASRESLLSPFECLRLEDVNFRYQNTKINAIDGISLEIKVGESIGLIGSSGSGKTTLVDTLLGLLEPQKGSILYNDKPLHDALEQWRSHVAYLPQQIFIIDNTLKCNVALGVPENEIDEARLQEAVRQASLAEVVDRLPQGVNTMLGERGVRLSGGQRQRVALARAFYHGRNVLVMDEATSALDNETELEIMEEIQQLKGKKTMIVIAHRLSTVEHCDRIYRLEKGKIVSSGSPREVLFNH